MEDIPMLFASGKTAPFPTKFRDCKRGKGEGLSVPRPYKQVLEAWQK